MIFRVLLSLILLFGTLHSEASVRCESAHNKTVLAPEISFAAQLDTFNQAFNRYVFKRSLVEVLTEDHSDKGFFQRKWSEHQVRQLRDSLRELSSSEKWGTYEFENFARQLEKLKFLSDPSATQGMSLREKMVYRQVRHSVLVEGLENFLFGKRDVPVSVRKKVFQIFAYPFQSKWMRWMMIWASVPHLNGKVIPWQLGMKVSWLGLRATYPELEPYLRTTYGKAMFNGFATVANRVFLAAILVGVPAAYYQMNNAKEEAIRKTVQVFTPGYEASKVIANPQYYNDMAVQLQVKHSVEIFQQQFGRAPTPEEVAVLKSLAQAKTTDDRDSIDTENVKATEMPQRAPATGNAANGSQENSNAKIILEIQTQ